MSKLAGVPITLLLIAVGIPLCLSQSVVEYAKPWEQGPNICAYYKPNVTDYKICPYCLPWRQMYAKEMLDFYYACCPGFKKTSRFDNQCVERERTWKLIPGLLRDHKLGTFADWIVHPRKGAGFGDIDNNKSANVYTVIAPYSNKVLNSADVNFDAYKGNKKHPVLFHVVKGRYYLKDFYNGMTLKSEYDGQLLKVTKYSNAFICIECRVLVEPDHEARNGVIHYFSAPLTAHEINPTIKRPSVMDLLKNNPETTSFANSIPADIQKLLSTRESCRWYTVFAPKNAAWNRVIQQYGSKMAGPIAAHHILRRGMYCSAAFIHQIKKLGPTFADEYVEVSTNKRGVRMLRTGCGNDWSIITKYDLMGCNGVVHVINKPLVPLAALSVKEAVKRSCTPIPNGWLKYFNQCDLRMKAGTKYAVLIPTDRAWKWWPSYSLFKKYYDRFQTDAAFRCRLIRYHIFAMTDQKSTELQNLWLQQAGYDTNNNDELWETDYFMKMYYGSQLYFHYSPTRDLISCRFNWGSIYHIDRVNMIPEYYMYQILKTRKDFSTHNQFTVKANMNGLVFKTNKPRNLYLVVRNSGYSKQLLATYNSSKWNLYNYLMLHWVRLYLWGGDIGYFESGTRHYFMSGLNVELIFDRERDGWMYIGYKGLARSQWAKVVEWNIYAIDGMIWVLDRPLVCPNNLCDQKTKLVEKEIWTVLSFACWESLRVRPGAKGKELEPWLDAVEDDQCLTNSEQPKKETSSHGGRLRLR